MDNTEETIDFFASDITEWFETHRTEKDLADVYTPAVLLRALAEKTLHGFEQGTQAYDDAAEVFERWNVLLAQVKEEILNMMRKENPELKELDEKALETFMNRNGYTDQGGWYLKED